LDCIAVAVAAEARFSSAPRPINSLFSISGTRVGYTTLACFLRQLIYLLLSLENVV